MILYVSAYAGFCFGVSLAVNAAYDSVGKGACMLGSVVHNPAVVRDLEDKGVRLVSSPEEIRPGESALIRAHGVGKSVIESLGALNVPIIDRTCPKVKRIHDIVNKACDEKKQVVIAGNRAHPEVIGIVGWCTGAMVAESEQDAYSLVENLKATGKTVCLVSQTTFNKSRYEAMRDALTKAGLSVDYHDTICLDTSNRQREIKRYAGDVDCVIVVGGLNSSNSTRLYEIASASCEKAIHVELPTDLDVKLPLSAKTVFVTGGASTPISDVLITVDMIKSACEDAGVPFSVGKA